MEDHLLLVSLNVAEGAEDAYHAWYQPHIREIVDEVGAIVSARRYEVIEAERERPAARGGRFMTLYEIAGDPASVRPDLRRADAENRLTHPPDGVVVDATLLIFAAVGPEVR